MIVNYGVFEDFCYEILIVIIVTANMPIFSEAVLSLSMSPALVTTLPNNTKDINLMCRINFENKNEIRNISSFIDWKKCQNTETDNIIGGSNCYSVVDNGVVTILFSRKFRISNSEHDHHFSSVITFKDIEVGDSGFYFCIISPEGNSQQQHIYSFVQVLQPEVIIAMKRQSSDFSTISESGQISNKKWSDTLYGRHGESATFQCSMFGGSLFGSSSLMEIRLGHKPLVTTDTDPESFYIEDTTRPGFWPLVTVRSVTTEPQILTSSLQKQSVTCKGVTGLVTEEGFIHEISSSSHLVVYHKPIPKGCTYDAKEAYIGKREFTVKCRMMSTPIVSNVTWLASYLNEELPEDGSSSLKTKSYYWATDEDVRIFYFCLHFPVLRLEHFQKYRLIVSNSEGTAWFQVWLFRSKTEISGMRSILRILEMILLNFALPVFAAVFFMLLCNDRGWPYGQRLTPRFFVETRIPTPKKSAKSQYKRSPAATENENTLSSSPSESPSPVNTSS